MALGHILMTFVPFFYVALACIAVGNGLFKPNVSTQVGDLYRPDDPRRDRGYSLFYVGINFGAFLAPLGCGTIGETLWLALGIRPGRGRHAVLGLGVYGYGRKWLPPDRRTMRAVDLKSRGNGTLKISSAWSCWRVISLGCLSFWMIFEQQGNVMALWADTFTRTAAVHLGAWQSDHSGVMVSGTERLFHRHVNADGAGVFGNGSRAVAASRMCSTRWPSAPYWPSASYVLMIIAAVQQESAGLVELAMVGRLFPDADTRRSVSVTNLFVALQQDCAGPACFDDARRLVHVDVPWELPCRQIGKILECDGQTVVLWGDGRGGGPVCADSPRYRAHHCKKALIACDDLTSNRRFLFKTRVQTV